MLYLDLHSLPAHVNEVDQSGKVFCSCSKSCFETHFVSRTNIIFKQARFNKEGELWRRPNARNFSFETLYGGQFTLSNEYRINPRSYEHCWISSWNKAWKKFRPVRNLNPWPLRHWCSALPSELTGQLGAGHYVGSKLTFEVVNNGWISNTSTTSSAVFITARIGSIFVSSTALHIFDFHIFTAIITLSTLLIIPNCLK